LPQLDGRQSIIKMIACIVEITNIEVKVNALIFLLQPLADIAHPLENSQRTC